MFTSNMWTFGRRPKECLSTVGPITAEGLLPVYVFIWFDTFCLDVEHLDAGPKNVCPQSGQSQRKGFFPVCVFTWVDIFCFDVNTRSHPDHLHANSGLVWTDKCFFRSKRKLNRCLQKLQECGGVWTVLCLHNYSRDLVLKGQPFITVIDRTDVSLLRVTHFVWL